MTLDMFTTAPAARQSLTVTPEIQWALDGYATAVTAYTNGPHGLGEAEQAEKHRLKDACEEAWGLVRYSVLAQIGREPAVEIVANEPGQVT